jgi:hypothetical protein
MYGHSPGIGIKRLTLDDDERMVRRKAPSGCCVTGKAGKIE